MEHVCVVDIETIPAQGPESLESAKAAVKPPANIKKPESIQKWMDENAENAAKEALAKTSFDPARGHICTISWAIDDDAPVVAHAETVEREADVIRAFFSAFRSFAKYTLVGHYIGGFDIRFILCRAVVLGIEIPRQIPRDPKPWDKSMFDTMTAWAGARGSIRMDNLASALGLEGKGDFDGSMVAEAWANGEHQKIADYCVSDVIATRDIYRKFQAVGW
ncbi:ribonuclease H-like domain-containing protein [Thalassobius sp. S69A]|uniref:ribonuclease H-like domain-containing protein n=1 Tax=Thalassobius sp. S69A TaxID=3450125 RepID=UPI004057C7D2